MLGRYGLSLLKLEGDFWNLGGSGFGTSGLGPCKVLQKFGPPFFYHPGHNGCPGSGGCSRCRNPRWCRCPSRSRSPLRHRPWCIGTSKLSPLKAGPAFCHRPGIPATPGRIAGRVGAPVSRCGKLFQILALVSNKIPIYCTNPVKGIYGRRGGT